MLIECLLIVNLFANYPIFVKNLGLEIHWKHLSAANALDQVQRINLEYAVQLDKPGKLTHLRRIKLTIANELPRFDLSLG